MREWMPRLVISSRHVRAVPDSLGVNLDRVNWLPVDLLAEMLVDLCFLDESGRARRDYAGADDRRVGEGEKDSMAWVFHLLNPREVTWSRFLPTIVAALNAEGKEGKSVEIVRLKEWVRRVRERARECDGGDVEGMLEVNPAAKILDFFEGLDIEGTRPGLALEETMRVSPKLRIMEGIKTEWMAKWLRNWL